MCKMAFGNFIIWCCLVSLFPRCGCENIVTGSKEHLIAQLEKVAGVYINPRNTVVNDTLRAQGLEGNYKIQKYLGDQF